MAKTVPNDRGYHQELMYLTAMDARRSRGIENAHVGTTLTDPDIDFATVARGFGVHGEGPDDISTDTDNPPAFSAVLPARAAEHAGGVIYDDPQLPQLQKVAYPDLAALKAALPVAKAFNEALHVAKLMPGWTIIASDADTGHIEASQQSRWFRLTDDIVIRVSCDVAGSRIDMRSTSRQRRSDSG